MEKSACLVIFKTTCIHYSDTRLNCKKKWIWSVNINYTFTIMSLISSYYLVNLSVKWQLPLQHLYPPDDQACFNYNQYQYNHQFTTIIVIFTTIKCICTLIYPCSTALQVTLLCRGFVWCGCASKIFKYAVHFTETRITYRTTNINVFYLENLA